MTQQMNSFELPEIDPRFDPLSTLDNAQSQNRYASDNKLFISFHTKAVINPLKSTEKGRAVFDQVDYIKIMSPGNQLSTIDAPVTDNNYMSRFGDRYRAWKAGQEVIQSGTPIESFPYLLGKIALTAELKAMNVHTVEQLADLPDNYKQNIMGGIELSRRAKDWIEKTSGVDAQVAQLAKQNSDLQSQLNALTAMMSGQSAATPAATKQVVKEK